MKDYRSWMYLSLAIIIISFSTCEIEHQREISKRREMELKYKGNKENKENKEENELDYDSR